MNPNVIEVHSYEEFVKAVDGAKADFPEVQIFAFFVASHVEGKSWCPYCVIAEPFVFSNFNEIAGTHSNAKVKLIYAHVGKREEWKNNPSNPFRANFDLRGVPTLMNVNSGLKIDDEAEEDRGVKQFFGMPNGTNNPNVIKVTSHDDYKRALESIKHENKTAEIYSLFVADHVDGKSWCPDCVHSEPFIFSNFDSVAGTSPNSSCKLIYAHVGDRDVWRTPTNPFRVDPALQLKGVPTLLNVNSGAKIDDECESERTVKNFFGLTTGVHNPNVITVKSHDEYKKAMENIKSANKDAQIYSLFVANHFNGKSWCPDCVHSEPFIFSNFDSVAGTSPNSSCKLIYAHVGDRDVWRTPTNPFRVDPALQLKGVPTLLNVNSGAKIDDECEEEKNVQNLFGM